MQGTSYHALGDLLRQERERVIPARRALADYLRLSWAVMPNRSAVIVKKIENGTLWSELEETTASPSLTFNPLINKKILNPIVNQRPRQIADYCRAISLTLEQVCDFLLKAGLPTSIVEHLPPLHIRPYCTDRHAPGGKEGLYR